MSAQPSKTGPGDKTYLGDGVFIHHDGHQVWVTTSNGATTTNEVALEPKVLDAMAQWLRVAAPEFARGMAKTLTGGSHD